MIATKKLNNFKVKPLELPSEITRPLKGHELFPINYPNIFICSKKFSGKTTTIFNILKKTASKRTEIIIFSSTINNDPSWKQIVEYFEKKGINVITYQGIVEGKTNHLQELTDHLAQDKEEKEDKFHSILFPEENEEEEEKKEKKPGPEYILVFDDLSNQLQNKSIEQLLKRNRHLRIMNIISSQYYNDLSKQSRTNLDFILLFKNLPEDKLELIHKESDLAIDFERFKRLYKYATEGNYNFLWSNLRNETFRKNFNLEISI